MNLTTKIAIAAGALTLTAGGIAAAVTTPEAAEPGLTTAEEQVGTDLPAAEDQESEAPESEESEDSEGAAEGTHGAEVSAVAHQDFETGREHGEAVSTVARDNHGAEVRAEHAPESEESEESEESDDESGDDEESEESETPALRP